MKLYVKRDRFKLPQKIKIETEDVKDWAALQMCVQCEIEKYEKYGWNDDDVMGEKYDHLLRIKESLEPANEIEW